MGTRRNTITSADFRAIAVLAAASALIAGFAGCQPTGSGWVDPVLTALLAGLTVWAAASAPWWSLVAMAGVAALFTGSLIGGLVGLVGAAAALLVGARSESLVVLRCVSAACSVQLLLRLPSMNFFGATALVAGATMVFVIVVGVQRRPRQVRRRVALGAAAIALLALVGTAGLGISAARARTDLRDGYLGLLDGLNQLQAGDTAQAEQSLRDSARALADAEHEAKQPWARLAAMVPVVAQHRDLMVSVAGAASDSALAAADALSVVDLDQLNIENGVIDVASVETLAVPLGQLERAVTDLRDTLGATNSSWLISPAADRIQRYSRRADQVAQQAEATSAAATIGPGMLGSDGARRYLMAFTSPAEARGLTGLMGNWAVITIDEGRIQRTAFGRTAELIGATDTAENVVLQASDEYFERYGPFGGFEPGGFPFGKFWSNVTMSPDMPTTASVMAQMYEAGRGETLDGVFVIDPAGLAALLTTTGPIDVPGLATPLDASNLEQFLLVEQYSVAEGERGDLLAAVAEATLARVLSGSLPPPQILARNLGPAATSGHIVGWAVRPDDQRLLTLIGMNGALPALNGGDGLAVVTNNASGSKIDSFLQRTVSYVALYDSGSGEVTSTATIQLENNAPATGYPDYVIGNIIGLPTGTNRTLLSVYSPLAFETVTLDGKSVGATSGTELGWNVYSLYVDLAPGQSRTVAFTFSGIITADDYKLVVRPQPLARPDELSIDVSGDVNVQYEGELARSSVLDATGSKAVRDRTIPTRE